MHAPEIVRVHVWISGAVQGVGFRFFAERTARRLGLSGFTRNLVDGRVEAAAEGPKDVVDAYVGAMHDGPPGARVEDVQVEWETPSGHHGFSILGST
ncbi:MAG TPA: acylphosphatase [bacterium]|nr:acylphosphatase [bacterium]